MSNTKGDDVNRAAKLLGQMRWKGVSAEDRTEAAKKAATARMKRLTKKQRSDIAATAAGSISPEKAKARALKAWETKRKKKEAEQS